ncbi:MAG TPA: serine hydrolase domain-containing protein, partial [Lapillicoccus sp.]
MEAGGRVREPRAENSLRPGGQTCGSPASPRRSWPPRSCSSSTPERRSSTTSSRTSYRGPPTGPTITMRNLLGMTSGNYDVTSNAAFNATFDADPDMPWSFADTLAIIKANAPLFSPGTNIAYCDSNYSILGEILQMVTGKPARAVIVDSIAAKLGLTHTLWAADSATPAPHPNGYVPQGYVPQGLDPAKPNQAFHNAAPPPKVVNAVNPALAAGAGSIISSLDDLKVWGREIAEGRLLQPATQAERLKARRFNGAPVNL